MDLQKVRDALITAIDAMGERRGYSEAFEYKYKEQWDEDDRIVREALAELEVKKKHRTTRSIPRDEYEGAKKHRTTRSIQIDLST